MPVPKLRFSPAKGDSEAHRMLSQFDRLGELSRHYGLNERDWFSLALRLAQDCVPGFVTKARTGRPPKNNSFDLVMDVELATLAKACTVLAACEWLITEGPWGGWDAGNLEKMYYSDRKRLRDGKLTSGGLAIWDALRQQTLAGASADAAEWYSLSPHELHKRLSAMKPDLTKMLSALQRHSKTSPGGV
jgi:hypothetical protein